MSKTFWFRLVVALPAAIAGQVVLRQWVNLTADVGSVGAFVTAIGTLYSVLTGFTVISVWQQFTDTDRAVKREARALSELYRYVGYVGDVAGVGRAREAMKRYRDRVVADEWPAIVGGKPMTAGDDDYFQMADAVNEMNVTTPRDVPAWAEAVRTLGEVSDARGERAVFVAQRIPNLLRVLLYIATMSLIVGMALLGFENAGIGIVLLAFTVLVSLLVLEVIDDLDDPFGGAWAISSARFEQIKFEAKD
jgi:hypothetical protein